MPARAGDSLADLDNLYFQGSPVELAKAVAAFFSPSGRGAGGSLYALSMPQLYTQVIADVRDGKAGAIHPELYRAYSENLRKAVSGLPSSEEGLGEVFEANLSRFAAYKAFHATQQLQRLLADSDGVARSPEEFDRMARAVLNTFNRYQAAEYNTAVSRARTAKQWADFSQEDNMFLFPNIRWLPSRSATPREEHKPFYNRVWAKTDPFWQTNQPGNLWNCKCDWEETDDPVTADNPSPSERGAGGSPRPARGLEGNLAETGQIFTDECTYIQKAGVKGGQEVEDFFRPIAEHHQQYISLRDNPDYQEVHFDWGTGGVKATHKDHNFDKAKGIYEETARDVGYKNGHSVILESEVGKGIGENYTEGLWNKSPFELASCESVENNNNIVKGLKHCASKSDTRTAVLYFPEGDFVREDVERAIRRYYGLKGTLGGSFKDFEAIYVVCGETVYQMR